MEKKKIFIAAAFTIYSHAVFSQVDTMRSVNLSEVNVVASRVEKNNFETPRSVTVITSEQLLQSGFTSLSDVLSEAGGIYITGTGQNPGTNESIFMRGANSNQTVILVDGIRISDASTVNNTADLSEISLSDIDRIEIIRGSHSTMYGSGAVGGVISIQTKHGYKKGLNANASVTAGTFGKNTFDRRIDALLGYTFENGLYLNAGIEKILVDGIDATIDAETDPLVYKNRDHDDWDRLTYHAGTGFHGDRLKVDFDFRATDMKTDLDWGAYKDDDNYTMDFKRNSVGGNISWKLNNIFNTQIIGGYTETSRLSKNDSTQIDESGNYDGTNTESNYSGNTLNADWQMTAGFKNADLLIGLSGTQEDMKQEDYLYSTAFGIYESRTKLDTIDPATTSAVYFHADLHGSALADMHKSLHSLEYFSLSFGSRFSNHSISGSQVSADVSLNIQPDKNSMFYLSWSTGYNNPSLYQLYAPETYMPWDGSSGTGLTRGNNALEAESNESFEVGFKQKLNEKFSYSISYFHSVTRNLIEYVYLWDKNIGIDTLGNDPFGRDDFRGDRYLNLGKQTTNGFEVGIHTSFTEKLAMEANATLVSGIIVYKPDDVIESQAGGQQVQLYSNGAFLNEESETSNLVRRPSEANISLMYSIGKKVTLIPSLRYVTSRNDIYYDGKLGPYGALAFKPVDAYTLLNLALNVNATKHISFNFRSENLLNEKYEEIHGFATLGRSIYATIKFIL